LVACSCDKVMCRTKTPTKPKKKKKHTIMTWIWICHHFQLWWQLNDSTNYYCCCKLIHSHAVWDAGKHQHLTLLPAWVFVSPSTPAASHILSSYLGFINRASDGWCKWQLHSQVPKATKTPRHTYKVLHTLSPSVIVFTGLKNHPNPVCCHHSKSTAHS
jgi:hypothetical protein